MGSDYKFRCFIYNPSVTDDTKPILQKGDKDIFVKELQEKLNNIEKCNLTVDGSFGPKVFEAVKKFQKKYNLSVDGIVGDSTWCKLNECSSKPVGVCNLTFLLNGKPVEAWCMSAGGQNYIRMIDLEDLGIAKSVTYNATKKMPEVKTR